MNKIEAFETWTKKKMRKSKVQTPLVQFVVEMLHNLQFVVDSSSNSISSICRENAAQLTICCGFKFKLH